MKPQTRFHGALATFRAHVLLNAVGVMALLLLVSINASAQTPAAQSPAAPKTGFVIRNARIFDGTRVIPPGDVLVENGLIKAVGTSIEAPPGLPEIDAAGKTLLPGLIDAHVHTMGKDDFLRSALALGVTTELDMGSAPRYAVQLEREQAEGKRLDLADLRSSGTQPTAPDGHGTEYGLRIQTISSPEEAQPHVDALIAGGADFIGEIIYDDGSEYGLRIPTLSKETLRAVIEAAHRRGKLAVVHTLSRQAAKDAIAAGADGLVHLFTDRAPDDEFVALAAQHHVFIIPTLSVLASIAGNPAGPALASDPRLAPYLSPEAIADLETKLPRHAGSIDYAEEAVRRLNAEGVTILAGTDAHNPGTAHGASLLSELAMLVDSGLTPIQALASATSINAAAFRLSDRGTIAAGKRADLLLVDGDPTSHISDINNVIAVWKLGVKDDRERYRAALDEKKAAEIAQRHAAPPAGSDSGAISDFEDGTTASRFGLGWMPSTGEILGGHKPDVTLQVVDGGAEGSRKALQIAGEINAGVFGWSGAMFFPGSTPMAPVNLSAKTVIRFWTKGDGRTYQVMLLAKSKGTLPAMRSFTAGPEWTRISIPLADFGTDGSDLQAMAIAAVAVPGKFTLLVDDIGLETTVASPASSPAASPAALTLNGTATPASTPTTDGSAESSDPLDSDATFASTNGWRINNTLYLWFPGIYGNAGAPGRQIGIDASPGHLLSHSKIGFQGLVDVQHDAWTAMTDILWTPLSFTKSGGSTPALPAGTSAKVTYAPVVLTSELGYRVLDADSIKIDALAGIRSWRLGAKLDLSTPAAAGVFNKSINWVDPQAGARIAVPLSRKLLATLWADAGGWGAGSQLDYQIAGALTYRVNRQWALDAAWRDLYLDYRQDQFHSKTTERGVLLGVTYSIESINRTRSAH